MWSHQVVFGLGHVGVVGPQLALVDLQCAAVVVHHLLVLSLVLTQQCQVIQLLSHIGVVLPQNLSTLPKNKRRTHSCSRRNKTAAFRLPKTHFAHFQ